MEDSPQPPSLMVTIIACLSICFMWFVMLTGVIVLAARVQNLSQDFGIEVPKLTLLLLSAIRVAALTFRWWLFPTGSTILGLAVAEIHRRHDQKTWRWPLWSTLAPIIIGVLIGSILCLPVMKLLRELS